MNTQKQIGLMVALLFLVTASCAAYTVIDLPIRAESQIEWHQSESVERGALLFANNCRTCHGIRGEGFVGPQLNKPEFQDQDPLVLSRNQSMLTRTLYCGRAGTRMPAWLNTNGGSLNDRQIEHLVNFLTAPSVENDEGELVNTGWEEAVEFAHNLNHETALVVSGDTLATIAKQHDLGMPELAELNPDIEDPSLFLAKDTVVNLPASSHLEARTVSVRGDRENLFTINESQFVGAMILADLNEIPYEIDSRAGLIIGEKEGISEDEVGLFPGVELQLPDGSVYLLRAGDTLDSVSAGHDASAQEIVALNRDLIESNDTTAPVEAGARIILPDTATFVVRDGDTIASIAELHNMTEDELLAVNQNVVLQAGSAINLPPGTEYTIQPQDTLASVSAGHGVTEDELAQANGLAPGTPIRPDIALRLPENPRYIVQGQNLDAIRQTLGGVTAESLGQAQDPPVPADHVFAIGTTLIMPPDSYGSAPPDALNPGTACVEHAVTTSAFDQITGGGGSEAPEAPDVVSTDVEIVSNATDWTVVADGTESDPNEGVVKVAPGTTITFRNAQGVHTVTIDAETVVEQGDFAVDQTYEQEFDEGGPFKITCDLHSQMLAWVFLDTPEEEAAD